MKFIAKEQPVKHLELGDIIECTIDGNLMLYMVISSFYGEWVGGYRLLNLKTIDVSEEKYEECVEIEKEYRKFKGFRIIKSSNLELREV